MSDKKLSREELAAMLEEQAKALRESEVSDEEVEQMAAAGCGCCGGCTKFSTACQGGLGQSCQWSCTLSSPGA